MKKTTFFRIGVMLSFVAAMIIAVSCGSSKKAAKSDEFIDIPCSGPQYQTTTEYMRANSSGTSADMEIARDKALTNARARLSAQIETFVSNLTDFYKKETRLGENANLETRFERLIREVYKNQLQGTYPVCEKMKKEEDGKYTAFVCIELGGEDMVQNLASQISSDEELKVDYDYEKFKKSYEEAMEELEKERGR